MAGGFQLEAARVILRDCKGLDTSRENREAFGEWFFPKQQDRRIMPTTIEHWLDEKMDADPEHLTGQKRSGEQFSFVSDCFQGEGTRDPTWNRAGPRGEGKGGDWVAATSMI